MASAIIWGTVLLAIITWYLTAKNIPSMKSTVNDPNDSSLPRGYRNNNPLNIRISKSDWKGKVTPNTDGSFEQFQNMGYGFRAAFILLRNYIGSGYNTIEKIISRWAPNNENHTASYITNVSQRSGISKNTIIQKDDKEKLIQIAYQMAYSENGRYPLLSDVETGWKMI